jgi:hypothetical protein
MMPPATALSAAENLARLRAMLEDESERDNWPEIEQAIVYLTATSVLGA